MRKRYKASLVAGVVVVVGASGVAYATAGAPMYNQKMYSLTITTPDHGKCVDQQSGATGPTVAHCGGGKGQRFFIYRSQNAKSTDLRIHPATDSRLCLTAGAGVNAERRAITVAPCAFDNRLQDWQVVWRRVDGRSTNETTILNVGASQIAPKTMFLTRSSSAGTAVLSTPNNGTTAEADDRQLWDFTRDQGVTMVYDKQQTSPFCGSMVVAWCTDWR